MNVDYVSCSCTSRRPGIIVALSLFFALCFCAECIITVIMMHVILLRTIYHLAHLVVDGVLQSKPRLGYTLTRGNVEFVLK